MPAGIVREGVCSMKYVFKQGKVKESFGYRIRPIKGFLLIIFFAFFTNSLSAQNDKALKEFEPSFVILNEFADKLIETEIYLVFYEQGGNRLLIVNKAGNNDASRSLLRSLLNGTPEQRRETVSKLKTLTGLVAQPFSKTPNGKYIYAVVDSVKVADVIDSCDVFGYIGFSSFQKLNEKSSLATSLLFAFNASALSRFENQLKQWQ